ncbi:MAG: phosphate regulon transcriptional regulator PhoB [Gammaproteobacteria bacterium]|nr:phosphate regulon transcriptional regulator PhoB [Gammaproteobacteria bacterium]
MGDKARLLVVEDEPALREMVAESLRDAGFGVDEAGDVATAWGQVKSSRPDLLVLDWMLPDVSGYEFLKRLRREQNTQDLPVIMLTAKGDEADRIQGLQAGADDYIAKPFSLGELTARVEAVLRRSNPATGTRFVRGELSLDTERHQVQANGHNVLLGPTEFRLLHFLMTHPDRVYSRAQLLDNAWGHDVYVEERTVDVQIRRLRKALEEQGLAGYVQTVRGFGYRFCVENG